MDRSRPFRLRAERLEDRRLLHTTGIVNPYTVPLTADYYELNFERVYNFAKNPTAETISPGDWSDPHIWSGGVVPTSGRIHVNYETTLSQQLPYQYEAIAVNPGAELSFTPSVNTRLEVGTLTVLWGGALEIGTSVQPIADGVTAELVIDDRPLNTTLDPAQHGTGLLVLGGRLETNGRNRSQSYVELAQNTVAGGNQLVLSAAVTGWAVGDQVFLPDTRSGSNNSQAEFVTIQAVSGNTVTLAAPLLYAHVGMGGHMPHAAHLGGNIIVRSENPLGTRGHVLITERSLVDVQDTVWRDLGRTTVAQLDNLHMTTQHQTLHVGTNQVGRYSFHLHHMYGPSGTSQPYQYVFRNNVIDGGLKWGLAVHDTHYGLIEDNVVVDVQGAGIVFEDSSETGNIAQRNFTGLHKGSGQGETARANGSDPVLAGDGTLGNPYRTVGDHGHAGTGIWLRGSGNIVRDNVTTNATFAGMFVWTRFVSGKKIPQYRSADPRVQGILIDPSAQVAAEFSGNESYASPGGFKFGGVAQTAVSDYPVSNLTAWATPMGIEVFYSGDFLVNGITLLNDGSGIANGIGFQLHPSLQWIKVVDADVRGFGVGFGFGGVAELHDSYFDNTRTNVAFSYTTPGLWSRGDARRSPYPVILDNVQFSTRALTNLSVLWPSAQLTNNQSMVYPRDILVYDYNGVAEDDFQLFMPQQAASYVMPLSSTGPAETTRFSPVKNATNAQLWEQYRITAGGRLLPEGAVSRAKITGLVAPIPADITNPVISSVQVQHLSTSSAIISWQTNEPATTQLEWLNAIIIQGKYGNLTPAVTTLTTSHAVQLDGLTPGVTYRYEPRSTDAAGNTGGYDVKVFSTDVAKHDSPFFVAKAPLAATSSPSVLPKRVIMATASDQPQLLKPSGYSTSLQPQSLAEPTLPRRLPARAVDAVFGER